MRPFIDEILQWTKSGGERRSALLSEMDSLTQQGIDCRHCTGVCCTSVANSMKVTPLETLDIFYALWTQNKQQEENVISFLDRISLMMKHCIVQYRLDVEIPSNGKREFLRRTYTCPFFAHKNLGCTINRDYRPYGCLGFNPLTAHNLDGEKCSINNNVHRERELLHHAHEELENREVSQRYHLYFNKLPLPVALLHLIDHL